ncbi:hypothetical protein [Aeromonas veronii]|nr:hypothetical protein [Aeromonas veronii]
MALKDRYQQIAKRSLTAANDTRKRQEKSGFHSYHAFESIGCALIEHVGGNAGRGVSHQTKINNFSTEAQSHLNATDAKRVSDLTVLLGNLRNDFLYPVWNQTTSDFDSPEATITEAQAQELRKQVKLVVDSVEKVI